MKYFRICNKLSTDQFGEREPSIVLEISLDKNFEHHFDTLNWVHTSLLQGDIPTSASMTAH